MSTIDGYVSYMQISSLLIIRL